MKDIAARLAHVKVSATDALAILAILLAMGFTSWKQDAWLFMLQSQSDGGALSGDARGFYDRAISVHSFYSASGREPFFPYLIKTVLAFHESGHTLSDQLLVRHLSGWVNLALTAAIALLAARLAGFTCGAVAAWLYAGTPVTAYYGVSGLRESTMGFLVISFVLLLLLPRRWPVRVGCLMIAAFMPLLRLEGLFIVPLLTGSWACLALVGGRAARRSVAATSRLCEAAVYAAVAWLAAAPFLIACKHEYGSYFYVTSIHATYWSNHEFAGQPGHLTREEVLANAYGGERTTAARYIFGEHSLSRVAARCGQGYWAALTKYVPLILAGPVRSWLIWFWIVGLIWSCVDWREKLFVPIAGVIAQLPFAFILPLNMVMRDRLHPGVEFRFSLPITPFVAVLAALGIVETVRWARRKWWA